MLIPPQRGLSSTSDVPAISPKLRRAVQEARESIETRMGFGGINWIIFLLGKEDEWSSNHYLNQKQWLSSAFH